MKSYPQTQGGRFLSRGDSFDPECWRTTHRLRVAQGILLNLGIAATYPEHSPACILNPANKSRHIFGYSYRCECGVGAYPEPIWPEWVTGNVFDYAYRLASEIQTERGAYNRTAAYESKKARQA